MSADTTSTNPVVRAIVGGTAPPQARPMAAKGMLPVAAGDPLEALVHLREDGDAEIAQAAGATLAEQTPDVLLGASSSDNASPRVLSYLAARADAGREVHGAV